MIDSSHSQDGRFTVKGHWWLPGSTNKVSGDLIYDEKEMTLALYGGLNDAIVDSPLSATPERNEFSIIHGESLNKVPITLLKSFYTHWTPDIRTLAVRPGTTAALLSSQLSCHKLIEGIHLLSPDDAFNKCRIEIPYLENWLGDSPFAFDMAGSGEHVSIDYTRPENEEFQLDAGKCLVRFIRSVRPPGFPGYAPSIEHRTDVELESLEPMPVEWFSKQASEIVDLFSLLYGGNIQSRQLSLSKNVADEGEVRLYYPRHKAKPIEYGSMDIVIRYENVKQLFSQILNNWLTATEATKRARSILLSSERRPSTFIELRFLPLVHAAEVLTKEIEHSTIVDPETFTTARNKMLASLPKDLPSELTDSIKSSLGWANGRTLKGKLKKMFGELQDATCHLFCIDTTKFVDGLVDTRNYYTHYSPKVKHLRDAELHWAIRKMSLMLRIFVLIKAGVPENDLRQFFLSHHRLSQERAVWSKITEEGSLFGDADNGKMRVAVERKNK